MRLIYKENEDVTSLPEQIWPRFRLLARHWIIVVSNIQHRADGLSKTEACLAKENPRHLFFVFKNGD